MSIYYTVVSLIRILLLDLIIKQFKSTKIQVFPSFE